MVYREICGDVVREYKGTPEEILSFIKKKENKVETTTHFDINGNAFCLVNETTDQIKKELDEIFQQMNGVL